jgi:prepilin-type processing-associated H-X9-DG protein
LLVVMLIIGILVAILLPAIQGAREAARRMQCQNNLKQLTLGALSHEANCGRFPTGGWWWKWIGDPDRGTDWRQPGGWIYNVLPYLEQQPLHDLQLGKAIGSSARLTAATQMSQTALPVLVCPSRRSPQLLTYSSTVQFYFTPDMDKGSVNDYAVNAGDVCNLSNSSYTGQSGPIDTASVDAAGAATFAGAAANATGVIWPGSMLTMAGITDGASNTYFFGERYSNSDCYAEQGGEADGNAMMGFHLANARWTSRRGAPDTAPTTSTMSPPLQDRPGYYYYYGFGSAHSNGINMSFCDGSVRSISYTIDANIHRCLGNRKDGVAIGMDRF